MERFCAYQERCENDVRRKLTSFHLSGDQKDEVVKRLKEGRFLDEERYVESFVRSKVKAAWGRQKLVAALRVKGIPAELVQRYTRAVPADDFREQLCAAMEKWRRSHPDEPQNSPKLVRHLLSKGFATEEILREL